MAPEATHLLPEHLNRKWHTSKILPFSANIVLGLYKAVSTGTHPEYVVKVFVNEQLQTVPACNGTVCPYNTLKEYLSAYLGRNCRNILAKYCSKHKNDPNSTSHVDGQSFTVVMTVINILISVMILLRQ